MADALELSIDTASAMTSIALSCEGALVAEQTWECGRDHSRQLLPAIDSLLARHGRSKEELTALFACIGPGSYAGIRSGMSTAKGLAFALQLPIVGEIVIDAGCEAKLLDEKGKEIRLKAAGWDHLKGHD